MEGGMEGYPSQQDPFQGGACTLSQGSLSGPDEGDLVGVHHVMGTIFQHEAHPGDPVSRHQPLLTGISESLAMTAPSHQQESGAPALSSLWHLSLILFTNKNLRTRKNVLRFAFLRDSVAKPQKNALCGKSSCLENKIYLRPCFFQDLAKICKCCLMEK